MNNLKPKSRRNIRVTGTLTTSFDIKRLNNGHINGKTRI